MFTPQASEMRDRGKCLSDCAIGTESPFVRSEEGKATGKRVWAQVGIERGPVRSHEHDLKSHATETQLRLSSSWSS